MKRSADQRTIGYVKGTNGCIVRGGKPFYLVRLNTSALNDLLSLLDQVAQTDERWWHALTATSELPSRLRFYRIPTPKFEEHAAKSYVRGTIYRITGRESINIYFSVQGALLIASRFRQALQQMRNFVLFKVPGRKIDLIEFLPDLELEAVASEEHARLGQTGETLTGQVWDQEDFADWEQSS